MRDPGLKHRAVYIVGDLNALPSDIPEITALLSKGWIDLGAHAAFWGTAARVLPALIDRVTEGDFFECGCCMLPSFVELLGRHSFDRCSERSRWQALEASGAQLA